MDLYRRIGPALSGKLCPRHPPPSNEIASRGLREKRGERSLAPTCSGVAARAIVAVSHVHRRPGATTRFPIQIPSCAARQRTFTAVRLVSLMSNGCSHEILFHFGTQRSQLNNRYSHQDQRSTPLTERSR